MSQQPVKTWSEYYQLGEDLKQQGNLPEAILAYDQAIKLNPQSFWSYNQLGEIFLRQEQYLKAIEIYQKAILIKDDFSWSYYSLGDAFSQLGQWEKAIDAYQKSIELNADFFGVYHQLGDAYSRLERWEDALNAYDKAITINPGFAWSYHNLGEALFQLEKFIEAENAYKRAIFLDPHQLWYYKNLAKNLIQLEKWTELIDVLKKGIQYHPQVTWFYCQLERAFSQLENWQEAIDHCQQAIELEPDKVDYKKLLGNLFIKSKQWDLAISLYKNLIELYPKDLENYRELALTFVKQEQWESAITYFIEILKRQPDSYECYQHLALILEHQGDIIGKNICHYHQRLPLNLLKQYTPFSETDLTHSSQESTLTRIDVYSAEKFKIFPSITLPHQVHTFFSLKEVQTPEFFTAIIPEGRAWGSSLNTSVLTSNHKLVTDLSTGCAELTLVSDELPPPLYIDGTVAFLTVQWGLNYYHWMLDIFIRFALLIDAGIDLNSIDKFVIPSTQLSYQKETLQLLGIPSEKIIETLKQPHIKARKLIVPSCLREQDIKTPLWAQNFLRKLFLDQNKKTNCERLYISRSQSHYRRVINEDSLINFLEKYHFKTLNFESLSVQEQAVYMFNARVIIAPHGAGLTNLVFCQPGTKVIELFEPSYVASCYETICQCCQLEHYYLVSQYSDPNILVDLDDLEQLMNLAGIFPDETETRPINQLELLLDIYQKNLSLDSNNFNLYHQLGLISMELEKWDSAFVYLIKSLQLKPDFYPSYERIAQILEKQGNFIDANHCKFNMKLSGELLKKYFDFTENLLTDSISDKNLIRLNIYPSSQQEFLSSSNQETIGQLFPPQTINFSEAYLTIIPLGRVWGDISNNAVINSENQLITDLSTGSAEIIVSSPQLPPPILIDGRVCFLSVQWGGFSYSFWMFNTLSRLNLLQQSGIDFASIDKFIVNGYIHPYQKETLAILGIPEDKIIDTQNHPHIQAKMVIVPSTLNKNYDRYSPWGCHFLRQTFLPQETLPNQDYPKRLYISREKASHRQLINHQSVWNFLEMLGFTKIILEDLSVRQQTIYMNHAEVIITPHGSGLTNLLFCQPGTKVIEIFSPYFHHNSYWVLSNLFHLEHYYFLGESAPKQEGNPFHYDILVDLDKLKNLMQIVGVFNG